MPAEAWSWAAVRDRENRIAMNASTSTNQPSAA